MADTDRRGRLGAAFPAFDLPFGAALVAEWPDAGDDGYPVMSAYMPEILRQHGKLVVEY